MPHQAVAHSRRFLAWKTFSSAVTLLAMQVVQAGPVLYYATGATPADLQPTIDRFRTDISLGGIDNGDVPGGHTIGRREVNWDDLEVAWSWGSRQAIDSHGLAWNGSGIQSLDPVSATDPNRNFGNINPSYADVLRPFSGDRLYAGNPTFYFQVPAVEARYEATVNAFGIVFSDVDLWGSATLTFLDRGYRSLGEFGAPANPGDGNFSFLGVRFDAGEKVILVGVRAGNVGLASDVFDGQRLPDGPITDVVAFDDIIFPEPQIVPEPAPVVFLTLAGCVIWLIFKVRARFRSV